MKKRVLSRLVQLEYAGRLKMEHEGGVVMEKKIGEILAELRPEFDFTKDVDFVEEGYLDSFDIVQLVAMLEKEYEVKIKGVDIVPENFSSVAAMAELLKKSGAK